MSYVTVYVIKKSGDVVHLGEARNNHGFAPYVWRVLAKKHGVPDPLMSLLSEDNGSRFWALFHSGVLTERDNTVLGATYDRVYIARENIQRVADAIRGFYEEYCANIVPTMREIAALFEVALTDPECRGVCFNGCSANENPWQVGWRGHTKEEKEALIQAWVESSGGVLSSDDDEVEEYGPPTFEARPFNFDQDMGKKLVIGGEPWELFDKVAYAASV